MELLKKCRSLKIIQKLQTLNLKFNIKIMNCFLLVVNRILDRAISRPSSVQPALTYSKSTLETPEKYVTAAKNINKNKRKSPSLYCYLWTCFIYPSDVSVIDFWGLFSWEAFLWVIYMAHLDPPIHKVTSENTRSHYDISWKIGLLNFKNSSF